MPIFSPVVEFRLVYDNISLDLNPPDSNTNGLFIRADGLKLYFCGGTGDRVYQYTLSSAWDLSTASYDSVSGFVQPETISPSGVSFKGDGTKMYVCGTGSVFQYTLSTAWLASSASYDSVSFAPVGSPADMFFKSDGTKLYTISAASDIVQQHTLSSAWDLSTAVDDNVDLSIVSEVTNGQGLTFNSTGTALYVIDNTTDAVHKYTLSSAWDLSTASYTSQSASVATEDTNLTGLVIGSSDSKMYVIGGDADFIYQYSIY